jgi:hypothetical protein
MIGFSLGFRMYFRERRQVNTKRASYKKGDYEMNRLMTYVTIASGIFLAYLPELLMAQQIPSAETKTAPAAASLNGVTYVAWTGKGGPPDNVWYYPNSSGSQQRISNTSSSYAPALATFGSTMYLAWTAPTGDIFYTTYNGVEWSGTSTQVCGPPPPAPPTGCPETMAAPALAASGSALYLAWTDTSTGDIDLAMYADGAWTFSFTPAVASPGTAPALAVYDDTLFLAWLPPGSSQIGYETYSLSSGPPWKVNPYPAPTTETAVPPALGVYAWTGSLYLAWTSTTGTIYYSEWNGSGWVPKGDVTGSVAQLTPALVSNTVVKPCSGGVFPDGTFSVVYANLAFSGVLYLGYDYLYMQPLFNNPGKCI